MERTSSSLIRTVHQGHHTVIPHMGLHLKKNMNASDCSLIRGIGNLFVVIVTKNCCVTLKIREYANFVSNLLAYVTVIQQFILVAYVCCCK